MVFQPTSDQHGPKFLNPNKTISRKAHSRASSAASSRAGSRVASRVNSAQVSRQGSEDEYETDDAATVISQGTQLDDIIGHDFHVDARSWEEVLADRIEEICDRKRSSVEGRENAYSAYIRLLLANYAREEIYERTEELADAFLKSIKGGRSEKEAALAVRALALTIITTPTEKLFDKSYRPLKAILYDYESTTVKAIIISTISIACFYVGSQTEITALMSYFLDIISSDGALLNAQDSAEVVASALHAWGLLATVYTGPPQDINDEAMDIFIEQLESGSVDVQTAAGENIALLYEMSYREVEDDIDEEQVEFWKKRGKVLVYDESTYIQKYQPYGRENDLLNTLSGLASGSKRYLNKKDKRIQHSAFQAILKGVEHPLVGDGRPHQKLTVRKDLTLAVDEWWKLVRVHGVKSMLRGGWQTHLQLNDSFVRKLG
ncbi:interferon-related developmental regulator-domain-containing protein [Terfezia claveryi]|nr:interferon-related developmental regulator-domain-containing protein [Terfezia claveryi]